MKSRWMEVDAIESRHFREFPDAVLEIVRYAFVVEAEEAIVLAPVHFDFGERFTQAVFLRIRHGPAQDHQRRWQPPGKNSFPDIRA